MVKAINEKTREREAVRRALRCAFSAFPANSPSMPNMSLSIWELLLRFSCNSPVFLIASSGVILLSFPAGSHAEIQIVIIVTRNVRPKTRG